VESAERGRIAGQIAAREERASRLSEELLAFETVDAETHVALEALDARLAELDAAVARAGEGLEAARCATAAAERRAGEARSRLEALQRIQESGVGLHQGVRETLKAAKSGKLMGIRGALAELISLPPRYDTAIEVALGGHLQDIVTDRWDDARQAIDHLKRSNAGRATFQPLDSVRSVAQAGVPRSLASIDGIHGVASSLLESSDELRPVLESLLGRTVVVSDIETARAALPHLAAGWSAVTLSGEIVRAAGSVTGGAAVRESGTLSRERDVRELPSKIAALESEWEALTLGASSQQAALSAALADRQRAGNERAALQAGRSERAHQRERLRRWQSDVQREHADLTAQLKGLEKTSERLGADLIGLAAEEDVASGDLEVARASRAELRVELETCVTAQAGSDRELNEANNLLAALDERLRAERRRESTVHAQRDGLAEELSLRVQRAAQLDGEIAAVVDQLGRLGREAELLAAELATVAAGRPPLEKQANDAAKLADRLDAELDRAQSDLLEAERNRGATGLSVERARGELLAIHQRIVDDLDLDDIAAFQTPGAAVDTDLPRGDEAEREIARLKERLRRVGYAGEDVVHEYEREADRHAFLRDQLADVHGAATSLRELLADLNETMRARFDATFSRVAEAFSEMFTRLFGGGTARLVLTAGEDGEAAGVDIVAQPPGKRLQSLALLSGGERALTAVALLFAILKVNPTPFCLLDEVDAALDEANIVRFREELQELAAETQAIVITHNRGTVDVADTLYGVSMRDDGVSQVLSLRLSETAIGA
jgi:chromosome segregation protein